MLEINPGVCIVVVGPVVTSSCLSSSSHQTEQGLSLTYHSVLQEGLKLCDPVDRDRLQRLLETSIDAVGSELDGILSSQNQQEEWMKVCFQSGSTLHHTPIIQLLLKLQSQDCRLVYTHYDGLLDSLLGSKPVLLTDSPSLEHWITGRQPGLLHIHGHHQDPASLVLHSKAYATHLHRQLLSFHLKELFRKRTVVFFGHDTRHLNPLLVTMVEMLIKEDNCIKNPPLFLSSTALSVPVCFLHFPISGGALQDLITAAPEKNFVIGII